MPLGTEKIHPAICESHASYLAYSPLPRQSPAHKGNLDRINKINRIRTGGGASHRGTKPQRKISISQSAMSLSQRHEDAKKKQSGVDRIYKINKIYRMATGCARCSGWQISHPLSLQASLRAVGCLISSFAARMTLSPGVLKNPVILSNQSSPPNSVILSISSVLSVHSVVNSQTNSLYQAAFKRPLFLCPQYAVFFGKSTCTAVCATIVRSTNGV